MNAPCAEAEANAVASGAFLGRLLDLSHAIVPDDLPTVMAREAASFGAHDLTIYLVDFEQRLLVPLEVAGQPQHDPLPVDTTLAGRAFRQMEQLEGAAEGAGEPRRRLWVPLLDGAERLGVVTFTVADPSVWESSARWLAAVLAELVVTKAAYGDGLQVARRRREMDLAAELRWALLPPLTFTSPRVTIAGILEPAYLVAGDTFDYALNGDTAHLAILDAMGHGLEASRIANLAVVSYRHARRTGLGLIETFLATDSVIADQFGPERFVTGHLATLHLPTGRLRWLTAGHPRPLLLRGVTRVMELRSETSLPFGLGDVPAEVAEASLEPGDSVLFFTDGVVEARSPGGDRFGREGLEELWVKAASSGQLPAETMRRLSHAVLAHHREPLDDDATLLLVSWAGGLPASPRNTAPM